MSTECLRGIISTCANITRRLLLTISVWSRMRVEESNNHGKCFVDSAIESSFVTEGDDAGATHRDSRQLLTTTKTRPAQLPSRTNDGSVKQLPIIRCILCHAVADRRLLCLCNVSQYRIPPRSRCRYGTHFIVLRAKPKNCQTEANSLRWLLAKRRRLDRAGLCKRTRDRRSTDDSWVSCGTCGNGLRARVVLNGQKCAHLVSVRTCSNAYCNLFAQA